jgi:organic radical activating enzyme
MKPNPNNFCGGNFQDWMEVMLTPYCNGKCSWCIEKDGFHPNKFIDIYDLVNIILQDPRKNVLLLGGEPTMADRIHDLINLLNGKNVYITTNGSFLQNILGCNTNLKGINISIHHYLFEKNKEITGLFIAHNILSTLKQFNNVKIRFNCNLIKGYIDSKEEIFRYIQFAKDFGATSVRFAELKENDESFVNLNEIFPNQYGLSDDPFINGCVHDVEINGMMVNFRQMCGLQTPLRKKPENPEQCVKNVLYYDGNYYNGWNKAMNLKKVLQMVADGKLSVKDAEDIIGNDYNKEKIRNIPQNNNSGGCTY